MRKRLKDMTEKELRLMKELKDRCCNCELFQGEIPDLEYLYVVHNIGMMAVAQYHKCYTYAIYVSEDMTEKQHEVVKLFLRELDEMEYLEEGDRIVVFSKKCYDATMQYNKGEHLDVVLAV